MDIFYMFIYSSRQIDPSGFAVSQNSEINYIILGAFGSHLFPEKITLIGPDRGKQYCVCVV